MLMKTRIYEYIASKLKYTDISKFNKTHTYLSIRLYRVL